MVWIPYDKGVVRPLPYPSIANKSKLSASTRNTRALGSVNDQLEPKNSNDRTFPYFVWQVGKNDEGQPQWIDYQFASQEKISKTKIYWFDDTPWGNSALPIDCKVYYKDGGDSWNEVAVIKNTGILKDKYTEIQFNPINATALRVEVKLADGKVAGVHEWIVE